MSEAQLINFELVSPEEKLISEPVSMATIPGEEGEFGVGADHCSLVASLKPGVVKLIDAVGAERKIFITGGFADVTGQLCTILAEEAEDVAGMDEAALESKLSDLVEDLELAQEAVDKKRIQKQIDLTKARLSAVKGYIVL